MKNSTVYCIYELKSSRFELDVVVDDRTDDGLDEEYK